MGYWRGLGFAALLLAAAIALLRGADAWRTQPVIAELHLPPAFTAARDFDFGRYRLSWRGTAFGIYAQNRPEKILWSAEGGFLAAGLGRPKPFPLLSDRKLICRDQSLESIERLGTRLLLKGHLRCADGRLSGYVLSFEDDGERGVLLTVALGDSKLDRLYLNWRRDAGERVYGFGELSGAYDMSGRRLVVALGAASAAGQGGRSITASQAFYLTSSMRAFHSQSTAYQVFDLRDPRRIGLEVHDGRLAARIYKGESPQELRAHQASAVGVMSTPTAPK
ncbi:hypothetical protein Pres01_14990 [Metapseudomonas resinovorans]|uniref:hypothetical protein n=1 Tax=Metapseudomonas resinovorans TaxID=53412 RepID=UPI0009855753|nr:hypothetical protein [Pseudomonas resinovorans]GLZ85448.1 hypothetical protein Pres01_14990 [Pseudomonas resinovorans]